MSVNPTYSQTPRQPNRILYILLGVGATLVCLCLLCVGIVYFGARQVVSNPTFQAAISTVGSILNMPNQVPNDVTTESALTAGQAVQGTATVLAYQAYTYQGKANDSISVTISNSGSSSSTSLNLLFGIYDTEGRRITSSGVTDIANNRSLTLNATLPADGTYTILVTGLSDNTSYSLTLNTH